MNNLRIYDYIFYYFRIKKIDPNLQSNVVLTASSTEREVHIIVKPSKRVVSLFSNLSSPADRLTSRAEVGLRKFPNVMS